MVDGLSMDQWITVRQSIQDNDPYLLLRESSVFAWVPTMTSVSRQAIFSGKAPVYFPATIHTTNSEEKLWHQFWESAGLSRFDITYKRGLGDGNVTEMLDQCIHPANTRVAGFVVDKVDRIMHGMQLGSAGMHNQILQWSDSGYLTRLIQQLLNAHFEVWLTSDHGNIECEGQGRPAEGVIAETRGERVRIYPSHDLRARTASTFTFANEWPTTGLPEDYYPLIAAGKDAFVRKNERLVAHGGISIEEVIVPLIHFKRKPTE